VEAVIMTTTRTRIVAALGALALAAPADAQWVTQHEQYYLQAPHNWEFRNRYAAADRLFNAFDYGHAILYEKLWTEPDAPTSNLEVERYDFLTKKLLVRPPRVPLEEAAIEVEYVQLAPEAKLMFEWAHILHRQIYDILADETLSQAAKDAEVARLMAYYRTRPDLAFSARPKSMALMQEQPYSLAFRREYPKFNGLIWAYHWLQVGLYEPLLVGETSAERQQGVRATVARFWQMLGDAPRTMPHQMPMTAAIAPRFAERYPEAAIVFDNLHSMHDVISDILANDAVPRDRKRAEILLAAERFRDDTSYVMSREAWLAMTRHMGVENMGGPSVGFLPALPAPTVTYGAVMTHDDRTGKMLGFRYGEATGGAHAAHGATPAAATPAATPPDPHASHAMPTARDSTRGPTRGPTRDSARNAARDTTHGAHATPHAAAGHDDAHARQMHELHTRLLADPVIRERAMADPALRRMLESMTDSMPAEHREHLAMPDRVTKEAPAAARRPGTATPARKPSAAKRAPARRTPAKAAPAKPAPAKPAHAGHRMPGAPSR
jgi:hypothetical protein